MTALLAIAIVLALLCGLGYLCKWLDGLDSDELWKGEE